MKQKRTRFNTKHLNSSHPYQSSCLFLKISQYNIIMLCRAQAALCQDEWNKSEISLGTFCDVEILHALLTQGQIILYEVNKCQSRLFIFSDKALHKVIQHQFLPLFSSITQRESGLVSSVNVVMLSNGH